MLDFNLKSISEHKLQLNYYSQIVSAATNQIDIVIDSVSVQDDLMLCDFAVIFHDSNIDNLMAKTMNFININNLSGKFKIDSFFSKSLISSHLEVKHHAITLQNNKDKQYK